MTVMPSGSDVADKAVSTEDNSEMIQLDAVLTALVDTKIQSIKRSSLNSTRGKWTSEPVSPRKNRLMSSSTASSQNRCNEELSNKNFNKIKLMEKDKRKSYRNRRYDSAPCENFGDEFGDDHVGQKHHNPMVHKEMKERRRASEVIHRNERKKHRYSRRISTHVINDIDSPMELPELLDVDRLNDDLTLIHFERTREALSDNGEYPNLHQSAYISQSTGHLKLAYEDEDYVALNLEDEFDGESIISGHYHREIRRARGRSTLDERYHRPRRKHKRKKHRNNYLPEVNEVPQVVLIDHDELPLRARWTIVATACLLFAMSLLLVGITLRMAPIIDDMGDERRASIRGKKSSRNPRRNSSFEASHRKSSVRVKKIDLQRIKLKKLPNEEIEETSEARRHRKIVGFILGTFVFLLTASIIVVIVTLTNRSFHTPPTGNQELSRHRAQQNQPLHRTEKTFRKENEELLNSLNRDTSVPENSTVASL